MSNDAVTTSVTPSLSILEAHTGPLKQIQFEARSRDPSAVAGASILASLSNIQKELSLHPPPPNGKSLQTGMSIRPSARDVDIKDANENVDALMGKLPGTTHELRPLLRMLAGSSTSEIHMSKLLEEQRDIRKLLKDINVPVSISERRQAYKDSLKQRILDPNMVEVSFDDFPYYLRCTH